MRGVLGLGLLAIAASSCAIVGFDLDGYHPAHGTGGGGGAGGSASTSGSVGGSGGGPVSCSFKGQDGVCGEVAPAGWSGPVAVIVGDGACTGDYDEMAYQGTTAPGGDPATCTCTCDNAPCGSSAQVTSYADVGCTMQSSAAIPTAACGAVTGARHVSVIGAHVTVGVSCTPRPDGARGPIVPGRPVVGCGGATSSGDCAGGAPCLPAPARPFDGRVCIFKTGDVACPAGLDKDVYFGGVDDQRGCADCTCGKASVNCPTVVQFFSGATCATDIGDVDSGASCSELSAPFGSVKAVIGSPCKPSEPMPNGKVEGADPTTFCCR